MGLLKVGLVNGYLFYGIRLISIVVTDSAIWAMRATMDDTPARTKRGSRPAAHSCALKATLPAAMKPYFSAGMEAGAVMATDRLIAARPLAQASSACHRAAR